MASHPPLPPFALGIGVIGHRPNRLPDAARESVKTETARVLSQIAREAHLIKNAHAKLFADTETVLTLVSALAEGADRLAVEAALKLGYVLDVPLPFTQEIYEADFDTPDSRMAFRDLIGKARGILTLPGKEDAKPAAYESAALTVLAQADILLAIWDGGPSAGLGGTTDILSKAARSGLPIIHIDANGKKATRLLWSGDGDISPTIELVEELNASDLDKALPNLLDHLVRPPAEAHEQKALTRFTRKRSPHVSLRPEFPLLMAMLGVRGLRITDIALIQPAAITADFIAVQAKAIGGSLRNSNLSLLAHAYGWADGIAVQLSQAFRGAFIINFVLAAFSVVVAASSLIAHDPSELADLAKHKWPFVTAELILIGLVISNTLIGRACDWHRRWLESRELAERLRAALPLWILGLRPAVFAGAEPAWTGWYSRAILRAEGLRSGTLDEAGLLTAREVLLDLLQDQLDYNQRSEQRMKKLDHRLEGIGVVLLSMTVLIASAFLIAVWSECPIPSRITFGVTAAAAALPALATATYGIRVIGDFEGIARRAERTQVLVGHLLTAVKKEPVDLTLLRARARATADALLGDVASWRLAVESRGLNVPG